MGRTVSTNVSVLGSIVLDTVLGMSGNDPDNNLKTTLTMGSQSKTMDGHHNLAYRDNNLLAQTTFTGAVFQDSFYTVYNSDLETYVFDDVGELLRFKTIPTGTVCIRYEQNRVLYFKISNIGVVSVEEWNVITDTSATYTSSIGTGVTITGLLVFNWEIGGKYHLLTKTTNVVTCITFDLNTNTFAQHSTYTGSDMIGNFTNMHVNIDGSVITTATLIGVAPGILSLSNKVQTIGSVTHSSVGGGVFSLITGSAGHYTAAAVSKTFAIASTADSCFVCETGILDGVITSLSSGSSYEYYAIAPGFSYVVRSSIGWSAGPVDARVRLEGVSGRRKKDGLVYSFSPKTSIYKIVIDTATNGITFTPWTGDIPSDHLTTNSAVVSAKEISNTGHSVRLFCDIPHISATICLKSYSFNNGHIYGGSLGGIGLFSTQSSPLFFPICNTSTQLNQTFNSINTRYGYTVGYDIGSGQGLGTNAFYVDKTTLGGFVTPKGFLICFFYGSNNTYVTGKFVSNVSKVKLPIFFPKRKARYKVHVIGGGGESNGQVNIGTEGLGYSMFLGVLAAKGKNSRYATGNDAMKASNVVGWFEGNWGKGSLAEYVSHFSGASGDKATTEKIIEFPVPYMVGVKPVRYSVGSDGIQGAIVLEELVV